MGAVSQQIVLSGVEGTPIPDLKASTLTDPGNEKTLISFVTTNGKTTKIYYARVTSRQWGRWKLKVGSDTIGSGRIGPGHPDSDYPWVTPEGIQGGETITLTYQAGPNTPQSDVEAYLQATEQ